MPYWISFPMPRSSNTRPPLPNIKTFMNQHNIKPHDPTPRVAAGTVVLYVRGTKERIYPDSPGTYRVYKAADNNTIQQTLCTEDKNIALTTHNVKGAIDLEEAKAQARSHVFKTSRGMMTGQQLLDSGATIAPTTREPLLDCWDTTLHEDAVKILVLSNYEGPYQILKWQSDRIDRRLFVRGWGRDEHAMETFFRLDNPVLKHLMKQTVQAPNPAGLRRVPQAGWQTTAATRPRLRVLQVRGVSRGSRGLMIQSLYTTLT